MEKARENIFLVAFLCICFSLKLWSVEKKSSEIFFLILMAVLSYMYFVLEKHQGIIILVTIFVGIIFLYKWREKKYLILLTIYIFV